MNEDEVKGIVDAAVAPLQATITRLTNDLNLYRTNGLDALRTRNLAYHALPYNTTVPTREDRNGTPEVIETGGVRYLYIRTSAGWESVALS